MKINKFKYLAFATIGLVAVGCVEDDNPSIDDYPWNYEITEVKAKQDLAVGMLLYNNANVWTNAQVMQRIEEDYDPANGQIGPNVKISMGKYEFYGTDKEWREEYAETLEKIVQNYHKAKAQFVVTMAMTERNAQDENGMYPNNLGGSDTLFLAMLAGKYNDSLAVIRPDLSVNADHKMKYAIMLNIQNFANQNRCDNNNLMIEDAPAKTYRRTGTNAGQPDIEISRIEVLNNWMRRVSWYFEDDTYFTIDGRPVLIFDQAEYLHTKDSKAIYDGIRAAIKDEVGKDVYIVCRQRQWTPPARWYYFWEQGGCDAVMPGNMANLDAGLGWDRSVWYNVFINEHLRVNREYYAERGIDYIPTVSPTYYQYIWSTAYNHPIIRHNPDDFRKRCWIAKMQMGRCKTIIVDAYNQWMFANAIEPTDEDYGQGWGDTYLNIVADEFKVSK